MALFALTYQYVDDSDFVSSHRPAHREYLRSLSTNGELLLAGPLSDPAPAGGLLIFDVPSAQRVEEIIDNDPFKRQGVIADQQIGGWTLSFGTDAIPVSTHGV